MRRAPTDRIPLLAQGPVWEPLLRHPSGTPAGLLVAGGLRPPDFHVLGHALLTAGTLADAADLAGRYHALVSQAGTVRVRAAADRTEIVYRPESGAGEVMHRQQVEAVVLGMVTAARWVAGPAWNAERVVFAHACDTDPSVYVRMLGCPVQFLGREHLVVIPTTDLRRPRQTVDEPLAALHRRYAEHMLDEIQAPESAAALVCAVLAGQELAHVTMQDALRVACMSERALRRALLDEGTSWRALLDEARDRRVRVLLETTSLPLDAIARHVGLSGAAALVRAFRRRHGKTPGAHRCAMTPGRRGGRDGVTTSRDRPS
ncbi:AraC family transcriptional regulator ligand-binding domain-containing protein [Streptomyces sp. NPDC002952]|uniref:AraC family transcriptional regulator n=1 Tax=Streptomyces sp. NPDC002952 TaxID=3364673 RepID=UPI00368F5813